MNEIDKPKLAKLILGVAQIYSMEVQDFLLAAFWNVLKPYHLDAVEKAFLTHLGDTECGQFMPKPSEIKRRIEGSYIDKAMAAWTSLDWTLRHYGTYNSVNFEDPIITAVVKDLGGWLCLGRLTDREYTFYRKDFLERYQYYLKMEILPQPQILNGIVNLSNVPSGFEPSVPILIGHRLTNSQELIPKKLSTMNYLACNMDSPVQKINSVNRSEN